MRVLVTGAGGQLGAELVTAFSRPHHDLVAARHADLDVTHRDAVAGAIGALAPDLVVHAAAWTAVDACESDPDRAWLVNALGCRHVAEAARRAGAHLVAVSTDYVFDGSKEGPYTEWDRPAPGCVYGRTKAAGEREVLEGHPGSAVIRTSWLSGAGGANIVRTVLRLADAPGPLAFVDDQRGCPTFAEDLAAKIYDLAVGRRPGIFHVTNQGATTWYGFARDILAAAGHDPERVRPIRSDELDPPRRAPRPANSVLDNTVLRLAGEPLLPDYHEPLARLVRRLTS
ncbi:MAG TPA: dTDP-4-dehydrorhamnose reductase [Acidimicrobiales bacterium]|nr:dTDP-4-dehydrorhamnose reductase [Acidimicrobiales bacterium]